MQNLTENKSVRQRSDEGYRRWFLNEYFDIIFWYNKKGGNLLGFQVCYNKNVDEKAFTWEKKTRSHHFVNTDLNENRSKRETMMTAILKGDAGSIKNEVRKNLIKYSGELDKDLINLIIEKIEEYNSKRRIKWK